MTTTTDTDNLRPMLMDTGQWLCPVCLEAWASEYAAYRCCIAPEGELEPDRTPNQ